ncbi:MAG: hypothetical protein AB7U73_06120, partial [Pirellulales bacterium]
MNWKTIALVGVVLLSLGLGVYWLRSGEPPQDPAVERVAAMGSQIMPVDGPRPSVEQQARAMTEMREEMRELSPEQRRQVFERSGFRERMRRDLDAYFELPPEKRQAFLDERIDEMERMRKAFELMRKNDERNAATGGSPGGAPGGGPSGPPPSGGPGGPPSSASGATGPGSPTDSRHERARRMLDSTTP